MWGWGGHYLKAGMCVGRGGHYLRAGMCVGRGTTLFKGWDVRGGRI